MRALKAVVALVAVLTPVACGIVGAQAPGNFVMVSGKVTAVSGDSITVTPIGQGQAVAARIAEDTRLERVDPASFSDIKVGDTVRVMGARRPEGDQPMPALRIQLGEAGAPAGGGGRGGFGGMPAKVKTTDPFVVTIEGQGDRPFVVTQDTEVVQVKPLARDDIKAGEWAMLFGTREGNTVTARFLRVGAGVVSALPGTIKTATKGALTIEVPGGTQVQVKLPDGTAILSQKSSTPSDIKTGELVAVVPATFQMGGEGDIEASRLFVGEIPSGNAGWIAGGAAPMPMMVVSGSVSKADPLTIRVGQDKRAVKLAQGATVVRLARAFSFDLKPGQEVTVAGRMTPDGSFIARGVLLSAQ